MTTLDPWQFRLGMTSQEGAAALGAFWLETGAGTRSITLTDSAGMAVGVLFGFPIDMAGKELLKTGPHQLDFACGDDMDAFADQVLNAFAGRYIWFAINDDMARIYMDCSGQIPCVFDPEAKRVTATANAMFDDATYAGRLNTDLIKRLRLEIDGWIPGDMTAHHGVYRLLPNHYLDLSTWQSRRHWPHGDLSPVSDPKAAVAEITQIVRAQVEALTKSDKKVAQALTAGRETRMLAAMTKPFAKMVEFVTVTAGDRHAVDTIMARKISAQEGLLHRELPRSIADGDLFARYLRRAGHCVVDGMRYSPSVTPIADTHYFVGGAGGEVARGFFWHSADAANPDMTPSRLLSRFGMPDDPTLHDSLARWRASIPSDDPHLILDLAYLELRMSAWAGAQFCSDPTLVRFAPLLTRRAVELMLRLPEDWKQSERMSDEVVDQTWPELAAYPYNYVSAWHSFATKAGRVLSDPGLLLKRLRKLQR